MLRHSVVTPFTGCQQIWLFHFFTSKIHFSVWPTLSCDSFTGLIRMTSGIKWTNECSHLCLFLRLLLTLNLLVSSGHCAVCGSRESKSNQSILKPDLEVKARRKIVYRMNGYAAKAFDEWKGKCNGGTQLCVHWQDVIGKRKIWKLGNGTNIRKDLNFGRSINKINHQPLAAICLSQLKFG